MAARAYAFDDESFHSAAPQGGAVAGGSVGSLAPDERVYYLWYQQHADRISAAFGEPARVPSHWRLPLSTRVAVISGGALLGWAVPIALASALLR